LVNSNCPVFGHYIRDGMAQASSFKSSIRYQVCNSAVDNDISHLSPIKSSQQPFSSITDDDLCEITISPATNKKTSLSLSSPNHHTSSLTHLIPATTSSCGHTSSSVESTIIIKSIQPPSSSPLPKTPLGSSSSINSLSKPRNAQQRSSINSSVPSNIPQSSSRQSIFGTLATTLTAVRKSSSTALALAQQRLSADNGTLFSGYQGKILFSFWKTEESVFR
jgi:hypothetical protein